MPFSEAHKLRYNRKSAIVPSKMADFAYNRWPIFLLAKAKFFGGGGWGVPFHKRSDNKVIQKVSKPITFIYRTQWITT